MIGVFRTKLGRTVLLHMNRVLVATILAVIVLLGCNRAGEEVPGAQGEPSSAAAWLDGSVDERFEQVARHLRGFDVAMVETGHRYVELYWAGSDSNWGYAEYQLTKIQTAIANGVERRPKRGQSARMLDGALQQVSDAIRTRDGTAFEPAFTALTSACNACHRAEDVAFVTVRVPLHRLSPVYFPASPAGPLGAPPAASQDDRSQK